MIATISEIKENGRKKVVYHAEFWQDEIDASKEASILHKENIKAQEEKQRFSCVCARLTAIGALLEKVYDK